MVLPEAVRRAAVRIAVGRRDPAIPAAVLLVDTVPGEADIALPVEVTARAEGMFPVACRGPGVQPRLERTIMEQN